MTKKTSYEQNYSRDENVAERTVRHGVNFGTLQDVIFQEKIARIIEELIVLFPPWAG